MRTLKKNCRNLQVHTKIRKIDWSFSRKYIAFFRSVSYIWFSNVIINIWTRKVDEWLWEFSALKCFSQNFIGFFFIYNLLVFLWRINITFSWIEVSQKDTVRWMQSSENYQSLSRMKAFHWLNWLPLSLNCLFFTR